MRNTRTAHKPSNPAARATACILAVVALAGSPPAPAHGGAWVQKRDCYYFKVSASHLSTTRERNFEGNEVDILSGDSLHTNTSYRDVGVSLYLEYGLTERLTIVGTLPFKVLTSKRTETSGFVGVSRNVETVNSGFGDFSVGLRYPLVVDPLPVSVQGSLKLPLGYDNAPENAGAPLGSGRVDLEGSLLAGLSLYPFPGYVTVGAGYRIKTGDLDDEFLFSIEAGASWGPLSGRCGLDGLYSTRDPQDLSNSKTGQVSSAVTITNQDILKLTPGLTFSLSDEISLVAEAFHVIAGRNTVTGTTYALGVVYRQ